MTESAAFAADSLPLRISALPHAGSPSASSGVELEECIQPPSSHLRNSPDRLTVSVCKGECEKIRDIEKVC